MAFIFIIFVPNSLSFAVIMYLINDNVADKAHVCYRYLQIIVLVLKYLSQTSKGRQRISQCSVIAKWLL